MTKPPWQVLSREEQRFDGGEQALAYLAPDSSFALYNDYERGRSILVRAPVDEAALSATESYAAGAPSPRPVVKEEEVEGYGVFTFPYGPVSMGVPEAGRFDLRTYGERILSLTPVAGYKSRRIASAVEGLPVFDAALRVERLAGHYAAAHVSAFLSAVESARGAAVQARELWVRALGQELQRIYNHLHVVAREAEAASQNVGLAQTHALAESILRLQGRAFGHRWLFGAFLPNGPRRALEAADRRRLDTDLQAVAGEFETLWNLFLSSRTFVDRVQQTCAVSRAFAVRTGAVGPTLRATGVAWDDRLRVPAHPYDDLFLPIATEAGGDALARLIVRAEEVRASFLLLEQLLDRWERGDGEVPPAPPVSERRGIGRVESPAGDLVYDVTVSGDRIERLNLRSASDANWSAFATGMRDAVFTDFSFAWESFGISFAETDR